MSVIYIIRLLARHALMLLFMPILVASVVFFMTRNQSKTYVSATKVYTGFTTGSSIVSLQQAKVDLFGSRAAFDNLISIISSRRTAEEVGLRLFTRHMMLESANKLYITAENLDKIRSIVPQEIKQLVVKDNYDSTYNNFLRYKESGINNFIYGILNYDHPHYSSKRIRENIVVRRVQNSDMIDISYRSDDPGICHSTLEILNEVFIAAYLDMEINQSGAVTQYFEDQLEIAVKKLREAEDELLAFNQAGNIINYYEQTRHIAAEQQTFSLEHSRIRMEYASAESVLKVLESKMTPKAKTRLNSQEILDLRSQLAEINTKITLKSAELESSEGFNIKLAQEVSDLNLQLARIQEKIRASIQDLYDLEYSQEGIPSSKLIQDWLDQVLALESARAKLYVGDIRMDEFRELFRKFAPMGAIMKSLERKIDVAENEYLSLINNLGLAKLNQQNTELNSNIKVIETPLYPLTPQPSKRKVLMILAAMVGFIIPLFVIVALELLDSTVKSWNRAQSLTGLQVVSMIPNMSLGKRVDNIHFIFSKGIDLISRKLLLSHLNKESKRDPLVCVFYSHFESEGKSTILKSLLENVNELNLRSLLITYDNIDGGEEFDVVRYNVSPEIQSYTSIDQFSEDVKIFPDNYFDFIFIEIPAIVYNYYPLSFVKSADNLFMILRANRSWDAADKKAMEEIYAISPKAAPKVILNGVNISEMESIFGDLPKKRSMIRRFLKNLFRLRFFSRNGFKLS